MTILIALVIAVPLVIGFLEWQARREAKQDHQEYLAKFIAFHKDNALNGEGADNEKMSRVLRGLPWESE